MDREEMQKAISRAMEQQGAQMEHTHDHGHDHGHSHDHDPASNVNIDVADIIKWLSSKRSTLWSTWAIDDDKGKEQAAQWFYREIESLIHHAITNRTPQTVAG